MYTDLPVVTCNGTRFRQRYKNQWILNRAPCIIKIAIVLKYNCHNIGLKKVHICWVRSKNDGSGTGLVVFRKWCCARLQQCVLTVSTRVKHYLYSFLSLTNWHVLYILSLHNFVPTNLTCKFLLNFRQNINLSQCEIMCERQVNACSFSKAFSG